MAFRTRCFGMTDVGRAREKNEDNFILIPGQGLYIVADGMGGHASGQLASKLAVIHISEFICIRSREAGYQAPYPNTQQLPPLQHTLVSAIRHANERIYIEALKDPRHDGMGTTIVSILDPKDDQLILAHAGDSRIYRYRNDQLAQVTRDHSLLNHMLDTGKLTEAEAENFPNKNVIFRALGLKDDLKVEIRAVPKRAGDLYLLCSDGLTDLVEDWTIAEVLADAQRDLKKACKTLINLANHNGGKDNITVMLLAVESA